jgi:hypothetical protein
MPKAIVVGRQASGTRGHWSNPDPLYFDGKTLI